MRKRLTKLQKQEYAKLALNLRMLRKSRGWTQVRAAKACKMSFNTYIGMEHQNANPCVDKLIKLAQAYRVTVARLWE